MRIDQSVIDEIKNKTDILDLVSEYVKLEKRGRNYIGLCPFHDEKTPSFTVSEDKQICHCFGCKKGGNVFQFTQEIKDVSFVEAVKDLGERVNIQVDIGQNQTNSSTKIASNELKMIEMHELIKDYYHYALMKTVEGEEALNYLHERGFTDDLIKEREIGYAPDNSHFCHDFLEKKGYDIELAFEAGLLSRNEENFTYFDRFRNRIMFPLKNGQGRIVGYSGRTYTDQEPKYLNSPETPIFQKRRILYNLNKARKFIRKQDEIILLEGFMDVIKSDYAGLKQVVASMGTQLSQEHITFLQKLTQNVTLMFDGDYAGKEATLKTGQALLNQGLNVYVVQLPSGMDPDDYIRKYDNEQFLKFVQQDKQSFVLFKVKMYQNEINHNDLAYEKHFKETVRDLSLVNSSIIRNKLIQNIADIFKVSPETIQYELDATYQHQMSSNTYPTFQDEPSKQQLILGRLNKIEKAERALIKHLTKDKDTFLNYYQKIVPEDFTNSYLKRIFSYLYDYYSKNDYYTISDMMQYIESNELREVLIELDQYHLNDEPYENEIEDYIQIIKNNNNEDSLESLNYKLREASRIGDSELQKYYLQLIVNKNKNRM
ncbi:DNA primase / replicative DNA helicase multi-domain protein [Staphylococcus epidermidis VCU036]|uniref:DNA primase n=1 Tax=Staphylococcus epidermidis TaxID=1282 RepID=UPI0004A928C7|nr:DNA primase [Staphylococcus epidermidis]KDP63689.1 DNA primase / replicative DNA helicase multi-domain protein [Staphylococcus epidermidis VCU036]